MESVERSDSMCDRFTHSSGAKEARTRRRKIELLVAGVAVSVLLTACGGNGDDASARQRQAYR